MQFSLDVRIDLAKMIAANGDTIYLNGTILPRAGHPSTSTGSKLLAELWPQHGLGFIEYVKGMFLVYVCIEGKHYLFTDHLGLKKVFYLFMGSKVIVYDKYDGAIARDLSPVSYAIFSIMYHHVGGSTPISGVYYIKPGHYLRIDENNGKAEQVEYWSPKSLLPSRIDKISPLEISEYFGQVVSQYIRCLRPSKVALTVTGGYDSRIILAALLNANLEPTLFTYGHKHSIDNHIAEMIGDKLGLVHYNYSLQSPSFATIDSYLSDIITDTGGMATLHRMHRLYATCSLMDAEPDIGMLFTGHMGGEVMKGIFFDDLITSPYVRRRWRGDSIPKLRDELLSNSFVRLEKSVLEECQAVVDKEPYWNAGTSMNHFLFSLNLKASLHHSQDVALNSSVVPFCVPVFVDVDFLTMLFKTKYSMIYNERRMKNPLRRINAYELNCKMISNLYPALADIPLGKRGMFTPNEYLDNKFTLISKRAFRYKKQPRYATNFVIGDWMKSYIEMLLPGMEKSELSEIIDFQRYRKELSDMRNGRPEKDWLRFTNAVLYYKMSVISI